MIDIESFTGDHVYLDANISIYAAEGFKKYSALCESIFQSIEVMKIHAVASEMTLAEVLVLPLKNNNARAVAEYEDLIRDRFDLKIAPVTRDVLRAAAAARASYGMKLPDAVHVATAQLMGSQFFFTADNSIKAPAPLKIVTLDELLIS